MGLSLWVCFPQRKEVSGADEEPELELDPLGQDGATQDGEATQVSRPQGQDREAAQVPR